MEDRCVVCGELIPEGSHVCRNCEKDCGQAARNMIRVQGRQIEGEGIIQYMKKKKYDVEKGLR